MTTVQDLGRPGFAHLGVSAAGAADSVSLRLANRLVGNADGAPALEMTLLGGRFALDSAATVAVVGGEFDCSIPMGKAVFLKAGDELRVGGCRLGARCYLAIRGGIEAKYDLGSASTHLLSGLGQMVRSGDVLRIGSLEAGEVSPRSVTVEWLQQVVRVTLGSQTAMFGGDSIFSLFSYTWRVSDRSNRQGIRLEGGSVATCGGGAMESEGVALGAVQVPPGGQPVILFVDAQTTGGYPVIANIAAVDMPAVGQLRPGAKFQFGAVSLEEARRLVLEREGWIRNAV